MRRRRYSAYRVGVWRPVGQLGHVEGQRSEIHDAAAAPPSKKPLEDRMPGHGKPIGELLVPGILLDEPITDGDAQP